MTTPAKPTQLDAQELSPAARQAVEQKGITGGWDARSLAKLLSELNRWDTVAEAKKATANKIFITGLILTIVGFFLFFLVGLVAEMFLVGICLFLVPLGVAIYGHRKKKAAAAIDLPNELRISLRPLLVRLNQDLHPDEKIKMTLDLKTIDSMQGKTRDLPPGRNRSLKQTTYECPLCTMRLPLADGSEAVLKLENEFHKFDKSYRSSRGKYKSKTKWKKQSTVSATLIPPTRINWESGRVQQFLDPRSERMTFVEKDGVMAARLERYYTFKRLSDVPEDAIPASDIIKMFVRLTAMRPQAAKGNS